MIYLDASLAVALLTPEEHSEQADAWFARQPVGSLFISGWVVTEVSSALALKVRSNALTLDRRAAALAAWNVLREASFLTLAVEDEHFEKAAQIADRYDLGLRGGDALHLAIARDAGCRLATFDKRMANAALELGVPVERF
ncbi:type II toxin-antitoxin system VapC family toxin [Sphingomonas sp. DT-207]|uniref:type II toxin-antitoxin system VapC family toxin n=1 Tax=Sphingomonas sp. DT-207 TaxID=3396167 RepID=UPI003F1B8C67